MKRRIVYTVLTLGFLAVYGVAAWWAAGGDPTGIIVLTIALFIVTNWTGRNSLRS